jgi:glycerol kinase
MDSGVAGYIAALDQGTTSTRCIIFDRRCRVVSVAQRDHEQIYPRPGWVEHDPLEIWRRTQEVIEEAAGARGLLAKDIHSLGIANQRETTVVWNKQTGVPVYNALVWQDTRVAEGVEALSREGGKDRLRETTGLPLSTYFSGLKIAWILDHVVGARVDAERGELLFGNVDSYLLWNMTGGVDGGVHVTDVTNASRTQLMNLQTLKWDMEILELLRIPRGMLPEIRSSSEHYGEIKSGVLAGVSICGVLGDQQAALVGQACFRPGQVKNTYGTGCFLLMNTGELKMSTHGLVSTVAYQFGKERPVYALEGSVAITGALVQWVRDNLGLIERSEDIQALAQTVTDNGGVYFVPAFSGLYAPYWKDNARGVIVGLTRYANKGHLARAVLEATAFQTLELVEAMEADAGIPLSQLRTDGGMVVNDLLMQFQADILDREVIRPVMRETTAQGAAYAAGLASGFFKGTEQLAESWEMEQVWKPQMEAGRRARLCKQWKKAVLRSMDWEEE